MPPPQNQPKQAKGNLEIPAQIIAYTLLGTFALSFCALLLINVHLNRHGSSSDELKKAWFELMKTASVLLGTALTTVIGYYFGQRESAQVRREAHAAEIKAETKSEEAETASKKAETAEKEVEALREAVKDVASALPSNMPGNFNSARADLRDQIVPLK